MAEQDPQFRAPAENFSRGIAFAQMSEYMGPRIRGKVRDSYVFTVDGKTYRAQVTTDRKSALDEVIGTIPPIGAILNRESEYWFNKTSHIVDNAVIDIPSDNSAILEQADKEIDVEVVVRSHMAKSDSHTSVWSFYKSGDRKIYGYDFPNNLKPNEELPMGPIITPTTKGKSGENDEPLTIEDARRRVDIVHGNGFWDGVIAPAALALFKYGQEELKKVGILMVDTKYEFGIVNGRFKIIDEMHTSDSSRFRRSESYSKLVAQGQDPESFDKEPLRDWLIANGYKGLGSPIPVLDEDIIHLLQKNYGEGYTMLTGKPVPLGDASPQAIREIVDKRIVELIGHSI